MYFTYVACVTRNPHHNCVDSRMHLPTLYQPYQLATAPPNTLAPSSPPSTAAFGLFLYSSSGRLDDSQHQQTPPKTLGPQKPRTDVLLACVDTFMFMSVLLERAPTGQECLG
jgi:hypothetical protein